MEVAGHNLLVQADAPPLQWQVLQVSVQESPSCLSAPYMSTHTEAAVVAGGAVVVSTLEFNQSLLDHQNVASCDLFSSFLFWEDDIVFLDNS